MSQQLHKKEWLHKSSHSFIICDLKHSGTISDLICLYFSAYCNNCFFYLFFITYSCYSLVPQVCLEGEISRQSILNSLSRGKKAAGDLIPWTVSEQVHIDWSQRFWQNHYKLTFQANIESSALFFAVPRLRVCQPLRRQSSANSCQPRLPGGKKHTKASAC